MKSVDRVRLSLAELGLTIEVVELPQSTRTASLAAQAVGCEPGAIVKSLIFLADGQPVLALVTGDRRADPHRLATILAATEVTLADAERVRAETGFAIGGVPPVGHRQSLPTLIDQSLSRYETVWAAAGAPNAVFAIPYPTLVQITAGRVVELAE